MASAAAELARSGLLKEIKAITILNVNSTPARLKVGSQDKNS
jgi:hypothetical protein